MKIKTLALVFAFAIPAVASATPNDTKGTATDKTTDKTTDSRTTDKSATTKTGDKTAAKLGDADMKVLAHVHHVNMMEIDMGKLAQRSGTAAVKRYGETIVRDHTTADKDVTALAKKRGIAKIPGDAPDTEIDKADMKMQMEGMANLKKLKAADFDREYLRMMVEGHDKELARNEISIPVVGDPDLKTLLDNRKTTLQRHADTARELQKGNAQASVDSKTSPATTPGTAKK